MSPQQQSGGGPKPGRACTKVQGLPSLVIERAPLAASRFSQVRLHLLDANTGHRWYILPIVNSQMAEDDYPALIKV